MKALFTAIYTYANTASTFKTAIGGRFYFYEAPQNTTFPFAVYNMISMDMDYHFDGSLTLPAIQISIFDNDVGATTVNDVWALLTARMDDAALSVTGYGTVEFRRSQSRLLREPEPYNTWHYATDYDLILSK